jgi:hypothetical protein
LRHSYQRVNSTRFSFLATFHSFVNARYSDISIHCNDFDAGLLISFRKKIRHKFKIQKVDKIEEKRQRNSYLSFRAVVSLIRTGFVSV